MAKHQNSHQTNHIIYFSAFEKFGTEEELAIINEVKSISILKKGQVLFHEQTNPLGVYIINSGKLKLQKTVNTKPHLLSIHASDEMLGYAPVIAAERHYHSAEALMESQVSILPKLEFTRILNNNVQLQEYFLSTVCRQLVHTEERLLNLVYKSVKAKLAETLLWLHRDYEQDILEGNGHIFFNRENLAAITGSTRETIIRILSEFRQDKVIKIEGKKFHILDMQQLIDISRSF